MVWLAANGSLWLAGNGCRLWLLHKDVRAVLANDATATEIGNMWITENRRALQYNVVKTSENTLKYVYFIS